MQYSVTCATRPRNKTLNAARPGENRDRDAYGRRAAEFAFSPPGRELQERLADRQQRFLRPEGGKTRMRRPGGAPTQL